MTRYSKSHGKYHISGSSYEKLTGSRAQVWHGTALKTSGGLKKSDLMQNKAGRIVSKAKHSTAKKEKRLVKHGYGTRKGHFGAVKLSGKSRKMRGGTGVYGPSLSPADYVSAPGDFTGSGIDGQGLTYYPQNSTDVQIAAGMAGGKRRRMKRSRKMRGGSGVYGPSISPAPFSASDNSGNTTLPLGTGIAGAGVTDFGPYSTDVQMQAGLAGGKRRRMKHSKKSHSRRMMGGTTSATSVNSYMAASSPLARALGAG